MSRSVQNFLTRLAILALATLTGSLACGAITPVLVTALSVSNSIKDLALTPQYLYAAHCYPSPSGLTIHSLSDPAHPLDVGYVDGRTDAEAVTVSGHYAYVIYSDGLHILDLSIPADPAPAGQVVGHWTAVTVADRYAYLTSGDSYPEIYVKIYDVSNPALPAGLGQITIGQFSRVSVSGNYAFTLNPGMLVSEVSDPNAPVTFGPYGDNYFPVFNDLTLAGQFAYTISYTNSFRIIDISTPTNPIVVYRSGWEPWPERVLITGNYAFLLCETIKVYDVSTSTNAQIAASFADPGYHPSAMRVSGNYAYVACYPGLLVYKLGISAPQLTITGPQAGAIVLSWPAPTSGFCVQETPNLTTPNWATLATTPVVVNGKNQVTLSTPPGNRFYRLSSQ